MFYSSHVTHDKPFTSTWVGMDASSITAHKSEKEVNELKSKQDIQKILRQLKKVLLTAAFNVILKMLIARSAM